MANWLFDGTASLRVGIAFDVGFDISVASFIFRFASPAAFSAPDTKALTEADYFRQVGRRPGSRDVHDRAEAGK